MYSIWIYYYEIIHTKLSNGMKIEERVELLNEVKEVFWNKRDVIPTRYKQILEISIIKLSNSELKGILFEAYLSLGDKEAYDKVNERSKQYLAKINSGISEEGYIIREMSLELVEKLHMRYDNA